MSGRIYLLNDKSELTPMEEAPYDSELLLQEMLASHPDLLAGEQINSEDPRRWLLVTREMSVPGEANGAGRCRASAQIQYPICARHGRGENSLYVYLYVQYR